MRVIIVSRELYETSLASTNYAEGGVGADWRKKLSYEFELLS
jgi:hypothetical protein